MAARLLFVFLLTALCTAQVPCTGGGTTPITNDSATFGCSSTSGYFVQSYTLSSNDPRVISFQAGGLNSGYNSLSYNFNYNSFAINERTPSDQQFFVPPGPSGGTVSYTSNQYYEAGAWTATMVPAPKLYTLVPGQTVSTNNEQSGGFVYFALPNCTFGSYFTIAVNVRQYQGLQPPGLFLSQNKLPTLTYFDYSNQTSAGGSSMSSTITVTSPASGWWLAGVFLYGTTADIDVSADWVYSFSNLENGVSVTNTVTTAAVYYQVVIPVGTSKLLLQVSRQVPGGHVTVYVGYTDPLQSNDPIAILDTSVNSYETATIPNPNPQGNSNPNPGVYIVAVTCDTNQCGYILEASWS